MTIEILFIDDQAPKYDRIRTYFAKYQKDVTIEWAKNFRFAQNNLQKRVFDLIILDMSFPVHGATSEDTTFEGLAGLHVLQFMWRARIKTPVIICTSHVEYSDPHFGRISGLDALKAYTSETFGDVVVDCVLMGADDAVWHRAFTEALKNAHVE